MKLESDNKRAEEKIKRQQRRQRSGTAEIVAVKEKADKVRFQNHFFFFLLFKNDFFQGKRTIGSRISC